MKNVAVNLLKPGIIFSEPVYIDGDNLFVLAGIPIQQKDINKLKDLDIKTLLTDGIACPDMEEYHHVIAEKVNADISLANVHDNSGAYRVYKSFIEQMKTNFLRISVRDTKSLSESINSITNELIQTLHNQKSQFISFILGGEIEGNEMAKSAVNIAIISILIANELKLPRHKIFNVSIGALLHDAGMLRIPKSITGKEGGLSDEERQQIRNHTLHSLQIITRELSYVDEVGDIVLQHHEHWDGTGYPERRAGAKINIGARIVSVADAFEAMISKKSYRNSMMGYNAMINILADGAHCFDPAVTKALIVVMGIYPIGSIVGLDNGIVARVVEVQAETPLRPKIQVLIDENKKIFKHEEGMIIDLLAANDLYITKVMGSEEISQYA